MQRGLDPVPMRRSIEHAVRTKLLAFTAIMFCGCSSLGFSGGPAKQADPDPEPDFASLIRANISTFFDASAKARNISITQPRRRVNGNGWTACVKASVNSVTGASIGERTYFVLIKRGVIDDRRLARTDDGCEREEFRAL